MESGNGVAKMTGTEVRCNTLKEAELIPDSAVPYTLPESRCNSSNHQRSKFESKARGERSHTLQHVWGDGHSRNAREVAALKRMKYSQLIREKIWQPGTLHTCQCVQSVGLQIAKKEREQVAVNWPLNQGEQQSGEQWGLTHTPRHGMPLENHVAHSACLISAYICLCARITVCSSPARNVFFCTPDCKNVYVWLIPVFLFGRIQYSEGWVFGGKKNRMKNDSIWNDDTHGRGGLCVPVRATCTHTLLWGSANILVKISHNLFNSTRLQAKNKLEIRLEKWRDPLERTFELSRGRPEGALVLQQCLQAQQPLLPLWPVGTGTTV